MLTEPMREAGGSTGDEWLRCVQCGQAWQFTGTDRAWFDAKREQEPNFQYPRRCRPCRVARRQLQAQGW